METAQAMGWGPGLVWATGLAQGWALVSALVSAWGLVWGLWAWCSLVVWPPLCSRSRLRRLPAPRWPSVQPVVRGARRLLPALVSLALHALYVPRVLWLGGCPLLPLSLWRAKAPRTLLLSWCEQSWKC